jgi:hypothetical protein
VFVTRNGWLHTENVDRVVVLAPDLLSWLLVFRGSPENEIDAYQSKWIENV